MPRAIITVGLGFGDEGKGATVDYLARMFEADLVVRYSGGSQAGHNVQLPDGRRHTFAQFGAGTFARSDSRPRTYLAGNVIIDPEALVREAEHLAELGVANPCALLVIHPRCLVTTIWHRALNQLRELSRGADRHGSCGQGIGEARHYWLRHGEDAIFAADLRNLSVLRDKLELLRQRALLDLQEFVGRISAEDLREQDLWSLHTEAIARRLHTIFPKHVCLSDVVPEAKTVIFEGAQGVLIDEYRGFPPYTTWSTVTPQHAWDLVAQMEADAVAVLGITRAYTTRHGEGPLPTWSSELTTRLQDPGNPPNRWQGSLRCGWLDLPLLRYAASVSDLDGIVVNHLDHVADGGTFLCPCYEGTPLTPAEAPNLAWQSHLTTLLLQAKPKLIPATGSNILGQIGEIAPVTLTGSGPTHEDRAFSGLRFRRRAKAQR